MESLTYDRVKDQRLLASLSRCPLDNQSTVRALGREQALLSVCCIINFHSTVALEQ